MLTHSVHFITRTSGVDEAAVGAYAAVRGAGLSCAC